MKSNTRFKKNTKGIECLNCKQPIANVDNFCSNCGQVNDTKPLSIKQYISEFFAGFFAFDTRTLKTLFPLIFKPGKVTYEYVNGERMKYVNPFQLYLHTSIIFFLVTGIFNSLDSYNITDEKEKTIFKTNTPDGKLFKIKFNTKEKTSISNEKIIQIIKNQVDTSYNKILKAIKNSNLEASVKDKIVNKYIEKRASSLYEKINKKYTFDNDSLGDYKKFQTAFISKLQQKMDVDEIDYQINKEQLIDDQDVIISSVFSEKFNKKIVAFKNSKTKDIVKALDSLGYEKTRYNVFLFKKIQNVKKMKGEGSASDDYKNNVISKLGIALFFMLPVFALFMKLIYIRRKKTYTEHLIFVFHIQTVFFLLLLVELIFERILDTKYAILPFLILFCLYLYKALLTMYKQGKWKTFFKFVLLSLSYFLLSLFGFLVVGLLAFVI